MGTLAILGPFMDTATHPAVMTVFFLLVVGVLVMRLQHYKSENTRLKECEPEKMQKRLEAFEALAEREVKIAEREAEKATAELEETKKEADRLVALWKNSREEVGKLKQELGKLKNLLEAKDRELAAKPQASEKSAFDIEQLEKQMRNTLSQATTTADSVQQFLDTTVLFAIEQANSSTGRDRWFQTLKRRSEGLPKPARKK